MWKLVFICNKLNWHNYRISNLHKRLQLISSDEKLIACFTLLIYFLNKQRDNSKIGTRIKLLLFFKITNHTKRINPNRICFCNFMSLYVPFLLNLNGAHASSKIKAFCTWLFHKIEHVIERYICLKNLLSNRFILLDF